MSFKSFITSLPLLWSSVRAFPAGPGFPNNRSSVVNDVSIQAAYSLIDTYDASNWLSKFDVQAIADPTRMWFEHQTMSEHAGLTFSDGFVNYVNQQQAQSQGLIRMQNNQVYMGVDTTKVLNPNGVGRDSVRIQSKKAYNHALVIADFAHIPGSNCGSWPAFWMVGPNWPNQGEIDIIEGVNLNSYNHVTLHSSPGCVPTVGPGGESGQRIGPADCGASGGYEGCGVQSTSPVSYGTPFNANGGGVYAALWTGSGIKVWNFATRDVPANIRSGNPDPNSWGQPTANFAGCNFDSKFSNQNIVSPRKLRRRKHHHADDTQIFDITFCGDWAGSVWGSSSCASINPSCNAYVASQPQSFVEVS
jgi:hypothetical protein